MEVQLQKWGNSIGIRIPKSLLNSLKVRENDYLKLEQKDNCIIMSKSNKNKVSLKKLFQEYKGDNLSKDFEWDSPRGNEIW